MKGPICFLIGNIFGMSIAATALDLLPMALGISVTIAVAICGIMADIKLS